MMKSAAQEISEWADRCRRWAKDARTREQRTTLTSLQKLLHDAALEAEDALDAPLPYSPARPKS